MERGIDNLVVREVAAGIRDRHVTDFTSPSFHERHDQCIRLQGRHGLSILELSRLNDVPHAHVCSGRGRCGTCRVRVDSGAQSLSPKDEVESSTLARVGAGDADRLACQARVLGDGVSVTRQLPAYADASAARLPQEWVAP